MIREDNRRIYDIARACPTEARSVIQGGKLKGKTDINPMWRIKKLTELFGPCGIGWKTVNEYYWTTPGADGEVVAWCSIQLVYKEGGSWSEPIHGIGGSMLVEMQKGNLSSNDEAYKMAYTDAISVACKALGMAADIYWQKDRTKYSAPAEQEPAKETGALCTECMSEIKPYKDKAGKTVSVERHIEASKTAFGQTLCLACIQKRQAANAQALADRAEEQGVAVDRA